MARLRAKLIRMREGPSLYKSIFRLDFLPQFRLLDQIGALGETMDKLRSMAAAGKVITSVDTAQQKISSTGELDQIKYALNMAITSLDGTVETVRDGAKLGQSTPLLVSADSLLKQMDVVHFQRIGYRILVIYDKPGVTFDKIRETVEARLGSSRQAIVKALGSHADQPGDQDSGIVLEHEAGGLHLRVAYGPYRKRESAKYFSVPPNIEEGMIFDIDTSQKQVEFPGFKLERFALSAEKRARAIILNIAEDYLNAAS